MPHEVDLPRALLRAGWKAKVFDAEGPEEPHVSIIWRGNVMHRVSLRTGNFLIPPGGGWNDVDPAIKTAVEADWDALVTYWNKQNPHNLV